MADFETIQEKTWEFALGKFMEASLKLPPKKGKNDPKPFVQISRGGQDEQTGEKRYWKNITFPLQFAKEVGELLIEYSEWKKEEKKEKKGKKGKKEEE